MVSYLQQESIGKKWVSMYTSFRSPWAIDLFLQRQDAESALKEQKRK